MYILSGLAYCFEYNYIDLKLKIKIIEANDALNFKVFQMFTIFVIEMFQRGLNVR